MAHEIARLREKHRELLELALQGLGPKEASAIVNMTPQGVGAVMRAPLFQQELARRRRRVENQNNDLASQRINRAKNILEDGAVKAAEVHVGLLENEDPRVAQGSANAILDRVLERKPPAQAQAQGTQVILSAGQINLINQTVKESDNGRLDVIEQPSSASSVA